LRIRKFDRIPSAEEFASDIERRNVPAVFTGCVKDWKAFSKWDVEKGGLEYLQELAGSSVVGAMLSGSAPLFYGDIRSHEMVRLPFATFIGYCKAILQHEDGIPKCNPESSHPDKNSHFDKESVLPQQIYLAQVSIHCPDKKERVQLECLRDDIAMPTFLEGKKLDSINLWMNSAQSRSSTHYDPHHNLLCIVSGDKQVTLWPPSAAPFLYLHPLYGEASNHSAIPLDICDLHQYPRAKSLDEFSQKVDVSAGDAVFIPEGWFHQVDSGDLTIAVNFWWQSDMMSGLLEHMDSYYLRRVLKSAKVDLEDRHPLHELEPCTLKSLHEIVSIVHDRVNPIQPVGEILPAKAVTEDKQYADKGNIESIFNLEDDPIANIIWNLDTNAFKRVILAIAHNFPRTLEAFVLHALSPVGAEVLTRKFEHMDHISSGEEGDQFYQTFYGVFDDPSCGMDALLSRKETFASLVFNNVLARYLGVDVNRAEP
ncbi:hypothetical protein M569_08531, partial [Genlisea aurea]